MDLDDIYTQIGEFGPRQKLYFFTLATFNLYPPFNMIQTVFTGEMPSFLCTSLNGTEYTNECPDDKIESCATISYQPYPDSFTKDWGLICDQNYKATLIQSVFMAGVMIGALTFGPVADGFGRRVTLLITTLGLIVSGVGSAFMPSYTFYAIARFVTGFFTAGNMISGFVLASELVGPSKRGICGNIIQANFAFGIIAFSLLGYFVRDWRHLSLISGALGGFLLIPFLWLPESPRWLMTHHKADRAASILGSIASSNSKNLPVGSLASASGHIEEGNNISLGHIFSNPRMCFITIVQLFSWFVNSVVYYGLTLAAGDLGSNIYMSEALSGFVEIPAYVATTILIEWSGRRKPLAGFMVFGGISCIIVKWSSSIMFPLLGKLAIAGSFAIIYIHSAELFPTVLRNSGLGLCSCFARVGGIISPLTSFANDITASGQFVLLGILSLSAGILNLWLPETLNKPMPETLQDLESLLSGYTGLNDLPEVSSGGEEDED